MVAESALRNPVKVNISTSRGCMRTVTLGCKSILKGSSGEEKHSDIYSPKAGVKNDDPPGGVHVTKAGEDGPPGGVCVTKAEDGPPGGVRVTKAGEDGPPRGVCVTKADEDGPPGGVCVTKAGEDGPPGGVHVTKAGEDGCRNQPYYHIHL